MACGSTNEGGLGDLTVSISGSAAGANGADRIDLDERGDGNLVLDITRSHITGNGDYDQSSDPDEDDGFDAHELDGGDLTAVVLLSSANDDFEEGFDFNENGAGGMRVTMTLPEASGSPEEGVDLEEDDDWQGGGELIARLSQVTADGNTTVDGDGGIKIRGRGEGSLDAEVTCSVASGNTEAGIHMREQHEGGWSRCPVQPTTERTGSSSLGLLSIPLSGVRDADRRGRTEPDRRRRGCLS